MVGGRYSFRGDMRRFASRPELSDSDKKTYYGSEWPTKLTPVDSMPSLVRAWPPKLNTNRPPEVTQSTQICESIPEYNNFEYTVSQTDMPRPYGVSRARTAPMFPTGRLSGGAGGSQPFPIPLTPPTQRVNKNEESPRPLTYASSPTILPPTLAIPKGGYSAEALKDNSNPNSPRLVSNPNAKDIKIPAAPNRPLPDVPRDISVLPVGAVATPYLAAASDLYQQSKNKHATFKGKELFENVQSKDSKQATNQQSINLSPKNPEQISAEEDMQGGSLGRNTSSLRAKSSDNGRPAKTTPVNSTKSGHISDTAANSTKKPGNRESSSPSLASKLSKSFYDLASGDRLKNWKNKLPTVRKQYSAERGSKEAVNWENSPLVTPGSNGTQSDTEQHKINKSKGGLKQSCDDSTYDLAQNYWAKNKAEGKGSRPESPAKQHISLREQRWRRHGDSVTRSQLTLSSTSTQEASMIKSSKNEKISTGDRRASQHNSSTVIAPGGTENDPFNLEALLAEVAAEDPALVGKKTGAPEANDQERKLSLNKPTKNSTRTSSFGEFTNTNSPNNNTASMEHRTKKYQTSAPNNNQRLYEEVDLPWHPPNNQITNNNNYQYNTGNMNQSHYANTGHLSFANSNQPHYANSSVTGDSDYGPLPPPARITPYSGVPVPFANKEGNIVRPIAFKPIVPANKADLINKQKQSNESHSDTYYNYSGPRVSRLPPSSDTEGNNPRTREKSETPRYVSDNELILGASANSHSRQPFRVTAESISRAPRQPPPNYGQIRTPQNMTPGKKSNGDYDIVPDFTNNNNENQNESGHSSRPFPVNPPLSKQPSATNVVSFAEGGLGKDRDSHQSSGYGTVGGSGSYGSRHSSGIHVTPSPSDSGVAELEAALRDRENELAQLRIAMESNEHAVVRVYHEKEDRWHSKLQEWASRLDSAVQAEQRLLSQVQKLQDERLDMQMNVQTLSAEKHGLQRKCKELETDYFAMKDRLQNHERHWAICRKCGDIYLPSDPNHEQPCDGIASCAQQNTRDQQSASQSPAVDPELKNEIDLLRHEVHELRDSLRHQISAFAQERNRWDEEKRRVLDYQRSLQDNYAQIVEKNTKLERRSSLAPEDL